MTAVCCSDGEGGKNRAQQLCMYTEAGPRVPKEEWSRNNIKDFGEMICVRQWLGKELDIFRHSNAESETGDCHPRPRKSRKLWEIE